MKIKNVFRWIGFCLLFGPALLWAYFAWMIRYSRHPEKYPFELRYKKVFKIMNFAVRKYHVNIHVEGEENIPDTPSFYCCNHQSAVDPVVLTSVFPHHYSFVAKVEVKKIPIIGRCCTCIDGLFLPREDLKESLRLMMKLQKSFENKEHDWVIFPEGTRNRDPLSNPLEFHHGTFRPAMKAGVPIVPCAVYGSFRLFEPRVLKQYHFQVKYLKPIMPEDYAGKTTEEVANMVRLAISKEISYNMIRKDIEYMKEVDPKDDHFRLGKTI